MENSKKINFSKLNSIHFVGIGGISMSALASYCLDKNKIVTGSDLHNSKKIKKLISKGAKICIGHSRDNVPYCDLLVYTGAIKLSNPEIAQARLKGIKCMERSEFLGVVSKSYNITIAVAGTHGKTTTTALLAKILIDAKVKPTVFVGGNVKFLDDNYFLGDKLMLTEACEYRASFLYTKNYVGIILNIEKEHLDFYHSLENEILAFKKFAGNSENLVCDYALLEVFQDRKNVYTVSIIDERAYIFAKNIISLKTGGYIFDCYKNGEKFLRITTTLIGYHNIYNILVAICTADILGVDKKIMSKSIFEFSGVERRMENIGKLQNASVYLDYAHHPTEISAVLKSCVEFHCGKSLIIFQPHTYSRTATLFKEFVSLFINEKRDVVLLPTYPAREKKSDGISSLELYKEIRKQKENVYYKTKKQLYSFLKNECNEYKYIFFIGAGDIDKVALKSVKQV